MIKDIIIHMSAGPHAQLPDTDSQDHPNTGNSPRAQGDIAVSADVAEGPSGRTLDWKRTQNETFIVPSQFLRTLITLPADHLNSHGTSKGSLGDLELAFDRFRDVLHERLTIKHKLGMLFCATLA